MTNHIQRNPTLTKANSPLSAISFMCVLKIFWRYYVHVPSFSRARRFAIAVFATATYLSVHMSQLVLYRNG